MLDHVRVSENMCNSVEDYHVEHAGDNLSDHSVISLKLKPIIGLAQCY